MTEQLIKDALNRAAESAPAWDDSLLPDAEPSRFGRRAWLAAAAGVAVIGGAAWAWQGLRRPTTTATPRVDPAASPSSNASVTPTPSQIQPDAEGSWPLIGTTWTATDVVFDHVRRRIDRPLAERPWLRIDPDLSVVGFDGCNHMNGRWNPGASAPIDRLATTQIACSGSEEFQAGLREASAFTCDFLGLRLVGPRCEIAFRPVLLTDEPPPSRTTLRVRNHTGRPVASVELGWPEGSLRIDEALAPGATSREYEPVAVYEYAKVELSWADGTTSMRAVADFVGELPLPVGRYTYVMLLRESTLGGPVPIPTVIESGRVGR